MAVRISIRYGRRGYGQSCEGISVRVIQRLFKMSFKLRKFTNGYHTGDSDTDSDDTNKDMEQKVVERMKNIERKWQKVKNVKERNLKTDVLKGNI